MTPIEDQRPDGGFAAPWSGGESSVDATCYRLDAAALTATQRERALDFLIERRRPDGTWTEDPSLADRLPPWLRFDDVDATAYLTWNCALMLARAGRLGAPPPIAARGFRQTRWLAAATLLTVGRSDEAAPLLDQLEAEVETFEPDDVAWLRRALGSLGPFEARPHLDAVIGGPGT